MLTEIGTKAALRLLGAAFLAIVAASCGGAVRASREEAKAVATRMESEFSSLRAAEEKMVGEIEAVYARRASLDLSVNAMDAEKGGAFALFEGGKFYYKTLRTGPSYYCSPQAPVDDSLRREIKLMSYAEDSLAKSYDSLPPFCTISFFGIHEPRSIAMIYPWLDVVSFFPPGLKFTDFEWYRRGLGSSGKGVWSALPFADLLNGWTIDLAQPVQVGGGARGVAVIGVKIMRTRARYLDQAKTPLLLLAADSTLMGASPSAKEDLGLKPIEDQALLAQLTRNAFAPATERLDNESRPPEIRALAARILAGERRFEQRLGAATWAIEAIRIEEIGFYLVGLARRG